MSRRPVRPGQAKLWYLCYLNRYPKNKDRSGQDMVKIGQIPNFIEIGDKKFFFEKKRLDYSPAKMAKFWLFEIFIFLDSSHRADDESTNIFEIWASLTFRRKILYGFGSFYSLAIISMIYLLKLLRDSQITAGNSNYCGKFKLPRESNFVVKRYIFLIPLLTFRNLDDTVN